MSREVLVSASGVSKKFCRSLKKSLWYGLTDVGRTLLAGGAGRAQRSGERHLRPGEFWAVDDISFELRRGECLALIGRNGAGKTTLMKMLNGLLNPDRGRIEMRGRIGALISLGAGFNPILSGRENIYVNGAILGLTKNAIDAKIDEIIDFADLRDFIEAPVQTYSSGMHVRLGFAVATALDPDILLLDEVLAVGDAGFRAKCFDRIGKLIKNCAVIFVSHDINQIRRICDTALWIKQGRAVAHDRTEAILRAYVEETQEAHRATRTAVHSPALSAWNLAVTERPARSARGCSVELELDLVEPVNVSYVLLEFETLESIVCQATAAFADRSLPAGRTKLLLHVSPLSLAPGRYFIGVNVLDATRKQSILHAKFVEKISIPGTLGFGAPYAPTLQLEVVPSGAGEVRGAVRA